MGGGEYGKLSAPSGSSLKLFLRQPAMTILSYRPREGSFTFFIETPLNFYQPRFSQYEEVQSAIKRRG